MRIVSLFNRFWVEGSVEALCDGAVYNTIQAVTVGLLLYKKLFTNVNSTYTAT